MSEQDTQYSLQETPSILPLFLTEDIVVFPGVISPVAINDRNQIKLVDEVLAEENKLLVISLKKPGAEDGERLNEPHEIGCVSIIHKMLRVPDGSLRLLIQGIARADLVKIITAKDSILKVEIVQLTQPPAEGMQIEALVRKIQEGFTEVIDRAQYLPDELKLALVNITDPSPLADFVASNLNVKVDERQAILSILDIEKRLKAVSKLLNHELQLLKLGSKIQGEVSGEIEKNQREYYLREQLKAIRKELGEDEENIEIKELRERLEELDAPDKVMETTDKEIERLSQINPSSSEYTVSRTYIDWLLDLPWRSSTKDRLDIKEACKILDRDHYGLKDVKERIVEYLAVRKLKGGGRGSIICFAGPPGVGKTSIGKSIAEAMGRKFVRMSLGGLRDEAEIRGHRRTYIGALPGRILQNLKKAGSNNPVFMLDEIDKLGADFRGDPASAMLEVLDPEQNHAFNDNYVELDFDLSQVMFITTANYLETIPPPLRDRMEIIKLPGYITPEKVQIAKRHLVPRQREANGLETSRISFTEKALENIVVYYTREAGVRTLERTIGAVCRKVAVKVASGKRAKHYSINVKNLKNYLGSPRLMPDLHNRKPRIGVANGLAWTPVGGVVLLIESIRMPGEGKVKVTGQLGNVMKESVEVALSLIRNRAEKLKIDYDDFKRYDLHIHFPEGATPKDGPSAGVTIITALASLFTGRPVRHDVAMTGEITLEGKVWPIGGLREKCVAAARSHMTMLICPDDNRADLEEIPDIVREKLEFKFVDTIDDVLRIALLSKRETAEFNKSEHASNG